METLKAIYERLAQNPSEWSYYSDFSGSILHKWKEEDTKFIEDYFTYAEKAKLLKVEDYLISDKEFRGRVPHTISTYLLGLKIAKGFGIDDNRSGGLNFRYYWFLTCLYHDFGYIYEKSSTPDCMEIKSRRLNDLKTKGLEAAKEICRIKYMPEYIFSTYTKNEIEAYLRYRAKDEEGEAFGCIDHGIVGGLLLYDRLRRQFEQHWGKYVEINENKYANLSRDEFYIEGKNGNLLRLSEEDFFAYAKAADAIIAHNVWKKTLEQAVIEFAESNEQRTTTRHNQRNNIVSKICPKDKYAFILSLADTLEPIKKISNSSQIDELLNSIQIEVSKKAICIKVHKSCTLIEWTDYLQTIDDLTDWLGGIKVEKIQSNGNDVDGRTIKFLCDVI